MENTRAKDFTETGLKMEGQYENDRNHDSSDLFKAVMREVYGPGDVIVGHHIIHEVRDKRADGFTYEVVQEIPSADALIFDHDVAKKLFGTAYLDNLALLAREPADTRDALYGKMLAARTSN